MTAGCWLPMKTVRAHRDPHLLLDAAEVDGEAELVILHRRARDRRRPRRQRAVHLQEIAGKTQGCHAAELTPIACRTTLMTVRCGEAGKRVRRNSRVSCQFSSKLPRQ